MSGQSVDGRPLGAALLQVGDRAVWTLSRPITGMEKQREEQDDSHLAPVTIGPSLPPASFDSKSVRVDQLGLESRLKDIFRFCPVCFYTVNSILRGY